MPYATRDDLESQYGISNIAKWADLDGTENAGNITSRIDWALLAASNDIDDRLREGPYDVPFDDPPDVIVRMTAAAAGVLLYESRGVTDYDATGNVQHQLQYQKNDVEQKILKILSRVIKLDLELVATPFPQVIEDE